MNVLFDDGISFDRRLRFEDKDPDIKNGYFGRYDATSEAFTFFSPIDNIWGDFLSRDMEEKKYDGLTKTKKHEKKIKLKERYYLKRILEPKRFDGNTKIEWEENTIGSFVDIVQLFPPNENLFTDENVIGLAFNIYERKDYNKLYYKNRNITLHFYLDIRVVVKDINVFKAQTYPSIETHKIEIVDINNLLLEKWDTRKDLSPPVFDTEFLRKVSPTLVLNKDTILKNRNYGGEDWENPPANWQNMHFENPIYWNKYTGSKKFDPKKYWGFETKDNPKRMVIRIGKKDSRYYLFLHGDQEAGCPIRIPTD